MAIANELRGTVHQGHTLAGMLYLHVRRLGDGPLAAKEASRGKVDHANASEVEKGRAEFRNGRAAAPSRKRSRSAAADRGYPNAQTTSQTLATLPSKNETL